MRHRFRWVLALSLPLAGCKAAGEFLEELFRERPPAPLEVAAVTSDARLDSASHLLGSLVGQGTSRQVHLLSSDTGLIADLTRRYGPPEAGGDVWGWLARRRVFTVPLDAPRADPLQEGIALAGSPEGHTRVRLWSLLLRGSACGWRGAQAELIVRSTPGDGPSLRGPVVGSFRAPDSYLASERRYREAPAAPSDSLTSSLLLRTERAMDSALARNSGGRDELTPRLTGRLEINTLDDFDAADVVPFDLEDGRVRYAVSLRERRLTAGGEEVVAATVMVWDSAGSWQQFVFRPNLFEDRRRRARARPENRPPTYWRRLEAVSGFAFGRDYLWMEQVNVWDGSVLWIILEPRGNNLVAAAEVDGPCR